MANQPIWSVLAASMSGAAPTGDEVRRVQGPPSVNRASLMPAPPGGPRSTTVMGCDGAWGTALPLSATASMRYTLPSRASGDAGSGAGGRPRVVVGADV